MTDAETIERLEEMQNYFSFMAGGKRSETIDNAIKAVKKNKPFNRQTLQRLRV